MLSNWREKAGEYFRDGLSISDISILLSISRQSVAGCIKALPDYEKIMEKRKLLQEEKRKEYKRKKQSAYRSNESYAMRVTGESLRREHELAVMELSRERYR